MSEYIVISTNDLRSSADVKTSKLFLLAIDKKMTPETAPNTLLLNFCDITSKSTLYRLDDNTLVSPSVISSQELFRNMIINPRLLFADEAICSTADITHGFVPLFFISIPGRCAYSQIRFSDDDILFLKTVPDLPLDCAINIAISKALKADSENKLFLHNHQCYYKKFKSHIESEYKFNITSECDIWQLTVAIYNELRSSLLFGWIPEYKDEFQQWDYYNYLYKLYGTSEESGYISFIPQTNGKCLVKRKIYQSD
jgi:hypothetical protein